MMRSDSSFNSPIIDSSWSGASASTADRHVWSTTETSEHERNCSSHAAAGLQPSGLLSQEGEATQDKSTWRAPCVSNDFPASATQCSIRAISRVVIGTLATAAAMSGLAGSTGQDAHDHIAPTAGSDRPSSNHLEYVFFAQTHELNKRIEIRLRILHQWAHMRTAEQMLNCAEYNILSPQVPDDWLLHWSNTPTVPGDMTNSCCPGTKIFYRDGREMRRTVDGQSRNVKASLVVQLLKRAFTLCRNPAGTDFDLVQSSTKDRLLCELELDRPSAIWISMPEGAWTGVLPTVAGETPACDDGDLGV